MQNENKPNKNMSNTELEKITDEHVENVAMLIYQYDYPKARGLPKQELKFKALDRYRNNTLTQKVVRDLVSLNLQTIIQIEKAMLPELQPAP